MVVTKWVGYVDDWCRGHNAYIVQAQFEETEKRLSVIDDNNHVLRALHYKSKHNKRDNPPIFDTWQETYDYLVSIYVNAVTKASEKLTFEELNLQAVLELERPDES